MTPWGIGNQGIGARSATNADCEQCREENRGKRGKKAEKARDPPMVFEANIRVNVQSHTTTHRYASNEVIFGKKTGSTPICQRQQDEDKDGCVKILSTMFESTVDSDPFFGGRVCLADTLGLSCSGHIERKTK